QLSPNINSGSRIDDGTMATTYGVTKDSEFDRTGTYQQHLTQLASNSAQNDTMSAVMALGSAMSQSAGITNSKRAGEQAQTGLQHMFSAMESLAHNEGINQSFGNSESSNVNKSLQEVVNQVKKFAADNKISDASSFQIHLGGGISGNTANMGKAMGGGPVGALLGALSAEARVNHQTTSQKGDDLSKQISSDKQKSFTENLANAISFMDDNKGSITDTSALQHMSQAQESHSKSQTYAEEAAANFQQQKTFNESINISRQKGRSLTTNDNDAILSHVAKSRFGGDMGEAASWQSQNPGLYQQEATKYLNRSEASMRPQGLGSSETIKEAHRVNAQTIKSAPAKSESIEAQTKALKDEKSKLSVDVSDKKRVTENQQMFIKSAADKKPKLEKNYEDMEDKHNLENEKTTPGRAGRRLIGK
ncbi:MAG: hypothetical protein K2X39_01695, partial [Silvanigrellaceae bacterium]|nr:hypothetical protein [Silvanigrellaceae bacterium]